MDKVKIAVFLGMYDYSNDNEYFDEGLYFCYPDQSKNPGCGFFTFHDNYINSYDFIMTVIERIERVSIHNYYCAFIKDIYGNLFIENVMNGENSYIVQVSNYETLKEGLIELINKFIDWFNENKSDVIKIND